jgi:hypothetical protein
MPQYSDVHVSTMVWLYSLLACAIEKETMLRESHRFSWTPFLVYCYRTTHISQWADDRLYKGWWHFPCDAQHFVCGFFGCMCMCMCFRDGPFMQSIDIDWWDWATTAIHVIGYVTFVTHRYLYQSFLVVEVFYIFFLYILSIKINRLSPLFGLPAMTKLLCHVQNFCVTMFEMLRMSAMFFVDDCNRYATCRGLIAKFSATIYDMLFHCVSV